MTRPAEIWDQYQEWKIHKRPRLGQSCIIQIRGSLVCSHNIVSSFEAAPHSRETRDNEHENFHNIKIHSLPGFNSKTGRAESRYSIFVARVTPGHPNKSSFTASSMVAERDRPLFHLLAAIEITNIGISSSFIGKTFIEILAVAFVANIILIIVIFKSAKVGNTKFQIKS